MTTDAPAVARLTKNFAEWQGLRWVPVGAAVVFSALAIAGAPMTFPVTVLVFIGADIWVDSYYGRRFGRVRPDRRRRGTAVAVRLPALFVMVLAVMLDLDAQRPVLFSGMVAGGLMVLYWWLTGRTRWHWPALAIAPVAAAFAPAAGVASGRDGIVLLLVVIGVVEVLAGVLDHRVLVAHLRAVRSGLA